MKKLNDKGFGPFYWILILLLLLLLAWLGWYVNSQKKNNKSQNAPSYSQQSNTPEPVAEPAAESKYLVIKEWGVRVKLTGTTADAYYLIKQDAPNYAYLSLTPLKNTDCAADKTTLGVYTRINNLSDVNNDTAGADGQTYAQGGYGTSPQAGGKYFYYGQPQAFCSNNETQDQTYWTEFKNILPTVEVTP